MFLQDRFSGLYPVVIDIETTGTRIFQSSILEIAMVTFQTCSCGFLYIENPITHFHVLTCKNFQAYERKSLIINGIKSSNLRYAIHEYEAIIKIFKKINYKITSSGCKKAILVAHNAAFDFSFLNFLVKKYDLYNPIHSFTFFDTATLAGMISQETVLMKACRACKIFFDSNQAHSAVYDAYQTAKIFCYAVNIQKKLCII